MGLFGKIKEKALSGILALVVRKLAEGDFGKKPAAVYWWLAGIKTYTAVAFASVGFALTRANEAGICEPCGEYASALIAVSGFLLAIGLFDGAVRQDAPRKPEDRISRGW